MNNRYTLNTLKNIRVGLSEVKAERFNTNFAKLRT